MKKLYDLALRARKKAYAPYSKFKVGAALETSPHFSPISVARRWTCLPAGREARGYTLRVPAAVIAASAQDAAATQHRRARNAKEKAWEA